MFKCLIDRDNVRWAHPEVETIYQEMVDLGGAFDGLYDESLPIEERRAIIGQFAPVPLPEDDPVAIELAQRTTVVDVPVYPGTDNDLTTTLTVVKPRGLKKKKAPCLFVVPAGGLMANNLDPSNDVMAEIFQCIVVSASYKTLLYDGHYPQTIDELEAAWDHMMAHAAEFGINEKKVVLTGMSSGGHLALALCHRLKGKAPRPRGCVVSVPCLDNRGQLPSNHVVSATWASKQNYLMQRTWLGLEYGDPATVPAEAFPANATAEECVGLPPTFIHAFENDIYTDSCMEYVSKLNEAGVYSSLHVWPGVNHDGMYTSWLMHRGDEQYPYTNMYGTMMEFEVKQCFEYDFHRDWAVREVRDELMARAGALPVSE